MLEERREVVYISDNTARFGRRNKERGGKAFLVRSTVGPNSITGSAPLVACAEVTGVPVVCASTRNWVVVFTWDLPTFLHDTHSAGIEDAVLMSSSVLVRLPKFDIVLVLQRE